MRLLGCLGRSCTRYRLQRQPSCSDSRRYAWARPAIAAMMEIKLKQDWKQDWKQYEHKLKTCRKLTVVMEYELLGKTLACVRRFARNGANIWNCPRTEHLKRPSERSRHTWTHLVRPFWSFPLNALLSPRSFWFCWLFWHHFDLKTTDGSQDDELLGGGQGRETYWDTWRHMGTWPLKETYKMIWIYDINLIMYVSGSI